LEGYSAPLGSFSPRITAALSLGIISRTEHDDCNTLRKIRNEFAHSFTTTFSDQKIIDLSKNLFHGYPGVTVDTFGQFNSAAVALIMRLTNRAHYVSKRRLVPRSCPHWFVE